MRPKKKLDVRIGSAKAKLDRFKTVRKRTELTPPSHTDLRASMLDNPWQVLEEGLGRFSAYYMPHRHQPRKQQRWAKS